MIPAVAGLKKQGANNGACLSFVIATPETGVDSIALTYSLLDPVITILRPVSAFVTAIVAGLTENFLGSSYQTARSTEPDRTCPVDGCCDGAACPPSVHSRHHTFWEKLRAGMRFAYDDLMTDIASWFLLGVLLAGIIAALVPAEAIGQYLGTGLFAYVSTLVVSLPMYICASMSTPVAAALVVKGMSPGAALVLLLAGPATNMATLTTIGGLLGRRTLVVYLVSIMVCTLALAYMTDALYAGFGLSAQASAGAHAEELVPHWLQNAAALALAVLLLRVYWIKRIRPALTRPEVTEDRAEAAPQTCGCAHSPQPGGT